MTELTQCERLLYVNKKEVIGGRFSTWPSFFTAGLPSTLEVEEQLLYVGEALTVFLFADEKKVSRTIQECNECPNIKKT